MTPIPARLTVALLLLSAPCLAMAEPTPHAARSKTLLPVTLEIDAKAADALARKSLGDLRAIYERLGAEAARGEDLVASGGDACACDVAHANLLIVIGFAINRRDGEGRYEDWMEDESLGLAAEYRGLVAACGEDAGATVSSAITDELITAP